MDINYKNLLELGWIVFSALFLTFSNYLYSAVEQLRLTYAI